MTLFGPYPAIVRDIHDGDTLGLDIDLGFGLYALTHSPIDGTRNLTCRLFGINAPELATDDGKAAAKFLQEYLPLGAQVEVTSHGWDRNGGRFDGTVVYHGANVSTVMIGAGHAVVAKYR